MKTDVVKPKDVFYNPTRLMVPLFQRPYVWSKETQWAPLWEDIVRLIEVIQHHNQNATHFLGAIVIQQVPAALGGLPMWNVIDGQQRLTTLQILLDALHAQLVHRGFDQLAGQVLPLIENPSDYRDSSEDQFKLWPTNRDREGFVAVMSASAPIDYGALPHSRLSDAHKFFSEEIDAWLDEDENAARRARTLVPAILDRLEIASISLDANEDAQAIFETLNARGTPLSAADLIKNFVFQNLNVGPVAAEQAYFGYWAEFETPWWEQQITTGRITNSRISLFLWQWLTARTLDEFPIREVFSQFKHYVNTVAKDIGTLLPQIKAAADRYRSTIEGAEQANGQLRRVELFSYRIAALDTEVARPLIIWLDEPEQAEVSASDKTRVLGLIESWLVRRTLVKAANQGTNRFIIDLLKHLKEQPSDNLPAAVETYLASNRTTVGYWPGDAEVREAVIGARAFTKYRRSRLRMVLEALEDARRGYPDGKQYAMGPVVRSKGTIEHLMPQKWRKHWHAELTEEEQLARDQILHQLGNLTLATQRLNSTINNGPWQKKREHLVHHDEILLTKDALNSPKHTWNEALIEERTGLLVDQLLGVWPAPTGHVGLPESAPQPANTTNVDIAQLVASGWIEAGARLRCRHKNSRWEEAVAIVSQDGQLYIGDTAHDTPSAAATAATGKGQNGWWWWALETTGQSLQDIRSEYLTSLGESELNEETEDSLLEDALFDPSEVNV